MFACEREKGIAPFPQAYAGVGLELTLEAAGARVVRVLPHGPSDIAGLRAGDVVLAVAGVPTRGQDLATVVGALRGPDASMVELQVRTAEGEKTVLLPRRALEKNATGYASAHR